MIWRRTSIAGAMIALVSCTDARGPTEIPEEVEPPSESVSFACTEVLGYSQTRQWFSDAPEFETLAGDSRWQLRWKGGAAVNLWADPAFDGWSVSLYSACVTRSTSPDRVLLSISGGLGADTAVWEREVRDAIDVIRMRYPSLEQIALQPVVGGPMHQVCRYDSQEVRASKNHPVIDAAIGRVLGGNVVASLSPEVESCSDYADALGHLRASAAGRIGAKIAAYYESD